MKEPRDGYCEVGDGPIETPTFGVECVLDMSMSPPTIVNFYLYHPKPYRYIKVENKKLVKTADTCESRLSILRRGMLASKPELQFPGQATDDFEAFLTIMIETYHISKKAQKRINGIKEYLVHLHKKLSISKENESIQERRRLETQENLRKTKAVDNINELINWRNEIQKVMAKGSQQPPLIRTYETDYKYCVLIQYSSNWIEHISFEMFRNVNKYGVFYLNEIIIKIQNTNANITKEISKLEKSFAKVIRNYEKVNGVKNPIPYKDLMDIYEIWKIAKWLTNAEQIKAIKANNAIKKKKSSPQF